MAKLLRPSHKQYEIQLTRIEKEDPYNAPEMLGQIWYNNTTNTAYIGTGLNKDSWEVIDHGSLSGLTDDDHSQYALLAGRSGDILMIDTINEKTSANGVVIDNVTLKDGGGTFTDDINADTVGTTTATNFNIKTNGINKVSVNPDGIVSMPKQSEVIARTTASQSIISGSTQYITNFTSDKDVQGEFTNSTGTFAPDVDGSYYAKIEVIFANNSDSTRRQVFIEPSSGVLGTANQISPALNGDSTVIHADGIFSMTAGKTLRFKARQDTGGNLNILFAYVQIVKIK